MKIVVESEMNDRVCELIVIVSKTSFSNSIHEWTLQLVINDERLFDWFDWNQNTETGFVLVFPGFKPLEDGNEWMYNLVGWKTLGPFIL
jgi:hypothetical protein